MWLEYFSNLEVFMFIAYDVKNGKEYGKLVTSIRNGTKISKTYLNLGLVIDKDKHIFKNRVRGVFVYDPENNIYSSPDPSFILPSEADKSEQRELIVDFGDVYFLSKFIEQDGILQSLNAIDYCNHDTLYAMICYYILCSTSNSHAEDWFDGSYVRIIYPRANLVSQRISEFLAKIGNESSLRSFFKEYLSYVSSKVTTFDNILIDSTGLPNSVHFPLTAISNHNGEISNELRLIYVTHQETGLPIYFRYVAGNIVDVTTLIRTIAELKNSGLNTKFAIMDAGYYSENNARVLFSEKVSFISRLKENLTLCKNLIAEHLSTLETAENLVEYNGRYVYVKCVPCTLVDDKNGYAYICRDIERKNSETSKLFRRAKDQGLDTNEIYNRMSTQGMFVLASSRRIAKDKILPTYYTRQQIEQIFDIGKNYASLTPICIRTEETLRGHLLLTFIASVIVKRIQNKLLETAYNPISMFMNLRNHKCKVYKDCVITQEPNKKANDCYKLFGIDCPVTIPIQCG